MASKLNEISDDLVTAVLGKKKKHSAKGSATRDLLVLLLLAGGVSVSLAVAPSLVVASGALATLLNKQKQSERFDRSFRYLRHRRLVQTKKSGAYWKVVLTPKGKVRAEVYWTRRLSLPTAKKWYGTWYVIIFDVPHAQKSKRDALRHFIKRHNCYPLQKSVWLYPFDCRREIVEIRELLDLEERCLQVIVANDIGDERRVRRHFGLRPT